MSYIVPAIFGALLLWVAYHLFAALRAYRASDAPFHDHNPLGTGVASRADESAGSLRGRGAADAAPLSFDDLAPVHATLNSAEAHQNHVG